MNYKLNQIFNFLIIYYWGMIYIQAIPSLIDTKFLYLLYIIPIGLFILYCLFILLRKKDFKFDLKNYYLIFFAFIAVLSSLSRFDVKSIASVLLLTTGIIFILKYKLVVNLNLLNRLFIISIFLSVICFYTGFSIYGFVPGQSTTTNSIELLAGRVSLFPNVSTSIYFSFFIFLLNLFFNQNKSKYFYMLMSLYFIYFGVSRTIFILFFLIMFLIFMRKIFSFKSIFFKIFPIFSFFLITFILIYFNDILNILFHSNNLFIKTYFLHNVDSIEQLYSMNYRFMNWHTHLKIFIDYPLGISSARLDQMFYNLTNIANGSESFLTSMLAHYGIASILFYLFIGIILYESFEKNNFYWYIFIYIFIFIGFLYGSFFTIYNVIYLILISSLNMNFKEKGVIR